MYIYSSDIETNGLNGILNHDISETAEINVETISLQSLLKIIWEQQKTISEQQKTIELQRQSISRFLLDSTTPGVLQQDISSTEEVAQVSESDNDLVGGNILK